MEEKTVLVTGIGGNVGQGVLRNIRDINWPIHIIGTNVEAFSAGNHLCDKTFMVPYAYVNDYIDFVKKIVEDHKGIIKIEKNTEMAGTTATIVFNSQ